MSRIDKALQFFTRAPKRLNCVNLAKNPCWDLISNNNDSRLTAGLFTKRQFTSTAQATPLPIIFLFERHWDVQPKQLTKRIIPPLAAQGYDTICLEAPHNLIMGQIDARLKGQIEFGQQLYTETKALLNARNVKIDINLQKISYSKLCKLMQTFVASKTYSDAAYALKNLPAAMAMAETFTIATQFSINIEGIDIHTDDYDKLFNQDINHLRENIDKNENYRNQVMIKNLLKSYRQKKGVIFIGGAIHATSFINFFNNHIKGNLICYFLHSSTTLDDNHDDISQIIDEMNLHNNHRTIDSDKDIDALTSDILAKVQEQPTAHSRVPFKGSRLGQIFNSHFKISNYKINLSGS